MAVVSPSSAETLDSKPDKSDAPENRNPNPNPDPVAAENPNPNPDPPQNPNPNPVVPPSLSLPSFAPSFRPLGMPSAPQYSTIPNPNPNPNPGNVYYQNPSPTPGGIQPPGVPMRPGTMYPPPPSYAHVHNGYMAGLPGIAPPASSCYGSW